MVDTGSCLCKVGFSGEDAPRAVFPSVVGRVRHPMVMVGFHYRQSYVGEDALSKRGILRLRYPVDCGVVISWEDMEAIWSHIFYNELAVSPEDNPVLLTEPPMNPKANREEMTRIMFEAFSVPALHVAPQPVLSMYASRRTTGVVVQSGHGVTCAAPICEGFLLPHATLSSPVAGGRLSEYFEQLLFEKGWTITSREHEILQDMKEKLCWVALDFDSAMRGASEHPACSDHGRQNHYELPGGGLASIGDASFRCPELLFQPSLGNIGAPGLHELTSESIQGCGVEIRPELFSNIVLAGASTLFPGTAERLAKELTSLAPSEEISVMAPAHRKHGEWLGAAIISSVSAFQQLWLTREEYDASGAGSIHEKCVYAIQ